jgi:DNA-binding transcriptional regulator/RsmH inhibitor MraZ
MSTTRHSLTGFHEYKMDPKFRVSIPVDWRAEKGETLRLQLSRRHDMPVIKVLTEAAFAHRVATIENSSLTPAQKDDMLGKLHMLCKDATLNEQGKLLIPKDWSEKAGLEADKEVFLAGRGKHFEVWNAENGQQMKDIETSAQVIDELGVF